MATQFLRALTATHRDRQTNLVLGMTLAFIAGAINAGGFFAVAQYTSHMTGIVSAITDDIVLGHWSLVLTGLFALLSFIGGAMTSAIAINWARRNRLHSEFALSLLLESFLLLLFIVITHGLTRAHMRITITVFLLSFIMGLQNAIATKISHARIRTTHVTGMVTDIGIELGRLFYWNRSTHKNEHHPVLADRQNLGIHLRILSGFIVGGISGAFGFKWYGVNAALLLSAWLFLLAIVPVLDDIKDYWKQR